MTQRRGVRGAIGKPEPIDLLEWLQPSNCETRKVRKAHHKEGRVPLPGLQGGQGPWAGAGKGKEGLSLSQNLPGSLGLIPDNTGHAALLSSWSFPDQSHHPPCRWRFFRGHLGKLQGCSEYWRWTLTPQSLLQATHCTLSPT